MPYEIESTNSSSFETGKLSKRSYIGLTLTIVFSGFLVMALESLFLYSPSGVMWREQNPDVFLTVSIISFIASLVGAIMIGLSSDNIVLGGVGYLLLSLTLGFTISSFLSYYEFNSIVNAFCMTCAYTAFMTCMGFLFPSFFSRIYGLLFFCLVGILIAAVVGLILGFPMNWLDWFILVVFGGLVAFDSYQMVQDEPTVPNAIHWATELYLDIANILMSMLSVTGNRRSD